MGSAYSSHHTNLGSDCTSFDAGATGTIAQWGDSFEVSMGNRKEDNDHTHVWGVEYKPGGPNKKQNCGFNLKATTSRDDNNKKNNGVESVYFGLRDVSADNETKFALKITRVARDGLSGGLTGVESSSGAAPVSFKWAKEGYTVETTIVSYGCSLRNGLFVLETKKKVNCENAYVATLSHYYVTRDVGLLVTAKICRDKKGNGFGVEVEGPLKRPGDDLRKVMDKICRKGVSPSKGGAKASTGTKTAVASNNSLAKFKSNNNHQGEDAIVEVVKHAISSSSVREQYNKGLINSNGYTTGTLNNSIIFLNFNP